MPTQCWLCAGLNLSISYVVAGLVHVVLIMIARRPSIITIRKLKRHWFVTYKTWKPHVIPGATQQGLRARGRKRELACIGLRFCLSWSPGWGPRA